MSVWTNIILEKWAISLESTFVLFSEHFVCNFFLLLSDGILNTVVNGIAAHNVASS